jgi:hypothetical protein
MQRRSENQLRLTEAAGIMTGDDNNSRRGEMTARENELFIARSTHTRSTTASDKAKKIAPVADSIAANAFAGISPEKHQIMAKLSNPRSPKGDCGVELPIQMTNQTGVIRSRPRLVCLILPNC